MKKDIPVKFKIADSEGAIKTLEGLVKFKPGDVIMTGVKGEKWPMPKEKFDATYNVVEGEENVATKKPQEVDAEVLEKETIVNTSWGAELTGKPGDYLITASKDDSWIVDKEVFEKSYDEIEDDNNGE